MERPMWFEFKRGGSVATDDLNLMRKQIQDALPLLRRHPDAGAMLRVAMMDLGKIEVELAEREDSRRPR